MRNVLLMAIAVMLPATVISADCPNLLDAVKREFHLRNPAIHHIQIVDVKPKLDRYWVLARGIREDQTFGGSFDDELFGVLIVSPTFNAIEAVLDVFPTKRWNDYQLWIESYSIERVVVHGRGATYADHEFEATYTAPE